MIAFVLTLALAADPCPPEFAQEVTRRVYAQRTDTAWRLECPSATTARLIVGDKRGDPVTRTIDLASTAPAQRARLVSLALIEQLDAARPGGPEESEPATAPSPSPSPSPSPLTSERAVLSVPDTLPPASGDHFGTAGASIVEKNGVRFSVINSIYYVPGFQNRPGGNQAVGFGAWTHELEVRYLRNVHPQVDVMVGGNVALGLIQFGGAPFFTGVRYQPYRSSKLAVSGEVLVRPLVIGDYWTFSGPFSSVLGLWAEITPIANFSVYTSERFSWDFGVLLGIRMPWMFRNDLFHVFAPGGRIGFSYLRKRGGFFMAFEGQAYVNMSGAFQAAQAPYVLVRDFRTTLVLGVQWKR